ncbi:MAG: V-type ATP synthase subunit D [Deltaproteobacteria bacterium]|nr:V-type ATP synthase subunit D [Deltaproteobacteria bacterium]
MADIIDGVKPTRMELLQLRKRAVLAERGHKLLKEKRDALIAEFLEIAGKVRTIRKEAEAQLASAYADLLAAQAVMGTGAVKEVSWNSDQDIQVEMRSRNIMGVTVPIIEMGKVERTMLHRGYGFADTSAVLDEASSKMEQALAQIVKLAEIEETVRRLALEVEKTKRRVNALEYIVLPRLTATVKYIRMRLDEMERESFTRLKKIKALLDQRAKEEATA